MSVPLQLSPIVRLCVSSCLFDYDSPAVYLPSSLSLSLSIYLSFFLSFSPTPCVCIKSGEIHSVKAIVEKSTRPSEIQQQ